MGAVLATVALVSCAGNKTVALNASDRAAMHGKTIAVTRRGTPVFQVVTRGSSMATALGGGVGGAIGGLISASASSSQSGSGGTIVTETGLQDPSREISQALAASLATKTGVKPLKESGAELKKDKPADLAAAYPQADYIMDVETTGWLLRYQSMRSSGYGAVYGAKLRLVDAHSQRVIAQGTYGWESEDEPGPTVEEYRANHGKVLKDVFRKASVGGTQTLGREVLGL